MLVKGKRCKIECQNATTGAKYTIFICIFEVWWERLQGKDTFVLKLSLRLAGSPPPSTEGGEGWCASAQTRRGRRLRRPAFVGKVTSPMESHKESFVDPRARHGFCIGSLALPQQNFATLRMTSLFDVYDGRMFARTRTARPYGFEETADCLYRLDSPHPPRAVPLLRWRRLY